MFERFMRNKMSLGFILVFIALQFAACKTPADCYAEAGNLRPTSAKTKNSGERSLRKDLKNASETEYVFSGMAEGESRRVFDFWDTQTGQFESRYIGKSELYELWTSGKVELRNVPFLGNKFFAWKEAGASGWKLPLLSVDKIDVTLTTAGGSPSVRTDVTLAGGAKGHYVQPAGTSAGKDEAATILQENDGFNKIMQNINAVNKEVQKNGLKADQLAQIGELMLNMDKEMLKKSDGKERLGAETTLTYQMSIAWAAARQMGMEGLYELIHKIAPDLAPTETLKTAILYNITNGGLHAKNSLDLQEFMVVTFGKDIAEGNRMNDEIDRHLGIIYQLLGLKAKTDDKGIGDLRGKEGGYKIEDLTNKKLADIYANAHRYNIKNLNIRELKDQKVGVHEFVLNCMIAAIKNAGYEPSMSGKPGTVALALDSAATSMLIDGHTDLYSYEGREISSAELIEIYAGWVKKYPIRSLEDGLGEDDWDGWIEMVKALGDDTMLVMDDLTVTQGNRLMKMIELLKANNMIDPSTGKVTKKLAILIKLNQNGFLTTGINDPQKGYLGTLEVIRLAKQYGIEYIISHRSKEAEAKDEEVSIGDLAAATNADGLKSGDHVQDVRAVKEDRLAEIDARERMLAEIAGKLNIGVEELRDFISTDKVSYEASAGEAFSAYINSVSAALQGSSVKAENLSLVISTDFFKAGGVRTALEIISKAGGVARIALYGQDADIIKTLLLNGDKNTIASENLAGVLAELSRLGVKPENTVMLRLPGQTASDEIGKSKVKQIAIGQFSTIGIAKAVREMNSIPQVDAAFEEFLARLRSSGAISEKAYDSNRSQILEKLQEAQVLEFSGDLTPAPRSVEEIKSGEEEVRRRKIGEFLVRVRG
ncbi:MAG: hypothetical protein PHO81_02775 [Candidatus Omnitrophica bacterium]|nr:hypothetical protein [Candidatus Omnitrophota bacterium]